MKQRVYSCHLVTPQAQHLFRFCISGVGGGGGVQMGPGKTNSPGTTCAGIKKSSHTEDTHSRSPVKKKSSSAGWPASGRGLDSILLPFEGKLRSAFSAFSPVECLVIYVLPRCKARATEAKSVQLLLLQFPVSIGKVYSWLAHVSAPSSDTHICLEQVENIPYRPSVSQWPLLWRVDTLYGPFSSSRQLCLHKPRAGCCAEGCGRREYDRDACAEQREVAHGPGFCFRDESVTHYRTLSSGKKLCPSY